MKDNILLIFLFQMSDIWYIKKELFQKEEINRVFDFNNLINEEEWNIWTYLKTIFIGD